MNTSRYLALFLLAMPGSAIANNTWWLDCKESCSSCTSPLGSCGAKPSTYGSDLGPFPSEGAAKDAAKGRNCTIIEKDPHGNVVNSTGGTTTSGGSNNGPGITTNSYKRSNLVFEGAGPDYVKMETVNGVRTPIQMPLKGATRVYTDLPDGFQAAQYPNSQMSAPDANGIRTLKPNAEPSSITIRRNPDGGTTTSTGKLDIVHKQRHPQTGEWVIRTIRKVAPQNNNSWSTSFYLGDPMGNTTLAPYRRITIDRTPHADGTETTHEVTWDRTSNGSEVITSDVTRKYAFYKHGEPVILSETRHTGTGSDLTTEWTYYTDPAQQNSFNKPATMRRTGGQWSNTTYQGNPVTGTLVTKTVSGWKNNPAPDVGVAPDENANRVVTEFEAKNETGTIGREEKIGGIIVSRTWGERYKARSGELVEKSNEQRGSATLTTIRTGYPDDDSASPAERGRLKSIQHPDGTFTLHRHSMQGENRVETVDTGTGSLSAVTDGTRTVSTYTKDDVLVSQTTSDIASGIELSARQAVAFDSNDQPTRWAYDNNLEDFSETLNGCCGIDSERTRDGVLTSYTRDGLKRPKTATSQGITLTYTYDTKSIGGTDFPTTEVTQSGGSLTLSQGTTVYDHAGNVIQQITPDLNGDGSPEVTSTTHDFAARTTSTTHPDDGTSVTTRYSDGQTLSTTGTAVPDFSQETTVGNNLDGIPEAVMKIVTTRPSGVAGVADQITTTYQAVGGLTLLTQLNGVTTATYSYDGLARPVLVTDGDGVKQHTAYNAKGDAYRRATSRDGNDTIDLGIDTVSDTETTIVNVDGFGPAIRTIKKIWTTATAFVASTSLQSPDGTKSSSTNPGIATPATTQSATYLDRADGSWTDTTTAPDGTKQVTTYSNWLVESTSSLNTENLTLETSSTGYDALRRPVTTTHSRTGLVTTHYSTTSGQVEKIDDHGRETSFKYDEMGRRIETTLPDNSKTHTAYSFSGQPIISWGSQTYPTYTTYDEQDRRLTLRTKPTLTTAGVPTDTGGSLTTWIYFPNGQLQQKQDAAGKGATYTYTDAGRLKTRTWERAISATDSTKVKTEYGYTNGLLTTVTYNDGTPNLEYTYDALGRQDTVKRGGVLHADYGYRGDTLALETERLQIDTLDKTLTRTYEDGTNGTLKGRPSGYTFTGASATYGYSPTTGRLSTITDGTNTFTYGYEPNSRLIATVTGPAHTVTNTWEDTRDVLLTKTNGPLATPLSKFTYVVNAIGQRETVSTTGSAFGTNPANWTWGYDSLGQVISADSPTTTSDRGYLYDSIGNRRGIRNGAVGVPTEEDGSITAGQGTLTYDTNPLNQYSSVPQATAAPVFDLDGNMTNGPVPGTAGQAPGIHAPADAQLTWDAENRLIKAVVAGTTVNYAYDHLSRLISRSVGVSPTSVTRYLYGGWNRIAEYESNGTGHDLKSIYLWGMDLSGTMQGAGGVGGLLSVSEISNAQVSNRYCPTYDGNGNVSEYVNQAGVKVAHFEYDPFGNLTVDSASNAASFPYRFSTKPQDPTTGLCYYGYRFYDPLTGRWPSRDPIGENGGVNLFCFLDDAAINRCDTLGLASIGKLENCVTRLGIDFELSLKDLIDKIKRFPKVGLGVTFTGDAGIRVSNSTTTCQECCGDGTQKELVDETWKFGGYGELEVTGGFIAARGDKSKKKDADLLTVDTYVGVRGNVTLSGAGISHQYSGGCSVHNRECAEFKVDLSGTLTAGGQIAGSFLGFEIVLGRLEGGLSFKGAAINVTKCSGEDLKFDYDGPSAEWIWRVTIVNVSIGGF